MSIFKNCEPKDFAMIPNKLLDDVFLSWKAKGVLCYLLRLPSDWKVHTEEIEKHSKDGIDSLNSAIKELIVAGYIKRNKIRSDKGLFKGYEYSVYNTPTVTDISKNGETKNGLSKNGKSKTTNTDSTKTDFTKTDLIDIVEFKEIEIPYQEIVEYLNKKATTKYRYTSSKTKELINTRFKEKFTLTDFITVIDKKCSEWLSSDMEKFLRPETLFSNKFEGYLNQKIVEGKKKESTINNYPQRKYDFDDLESKLLGKNK